MRFSFQQQVVTGIATSIIFVLLVGLSSYNALIVQQENSAMVNHTRDVMKSSGAVKNLLLTAESNIRGFALTRNYMFESSYQVANQAIWDEVNTLKFLVRDNATQAPRMDTLSAILKEKLDLMSSQLDILKIGSVSPDSLKQIILRGKNLSSKIEFNFSRIEHLEQSLLIERELKARESSSQAKMFIVFGTGIFLLVIFVLFYFIRKTYNAQIASEEETKRANALLERISVSDQEKNWILSSSGDISVAIRGEPSKNELAHNLVHKLAEVTGAVIAVMYVKAQHAEHLELAVTLGVDDRSLVPNEVLPGQGLLGQIVSDRVSFKQMDVVPGYFQVISGAGRTKPGTILIKSLIFEESVLGIIELAFFEKPAPAVATLLDAISENGAIALMAARARETMKELLDKTQKQAEELESQQEELTATNDDLIRHTALLQVSEEELRVQQEELRQINTVLEEKAVMLEEQKTTLEEARDQLERKADELERSGRFKSEFLANMSHELRTPLNSILILSRILADNKGARLSEEEERYASVIHNSGSDLLTLINDILDLAKVEAGKVELMHENIQTEFLLIEIKNTFGKVAEGKGLRLEVASDETCPPLMYLDHVRLLQILRNLLSNAIKFTPAPGTVSFAVSQRGGYWEFVVADSGIGIPADKQDAIFESFQQADGSISRKYGGTGLGLSITRELTNIFNGHLSLKSTPGQGSVFTVHIPVIAEPGGVDNEQYKETSAAVSNVVTGTLTLNKEEPVHRLLLIEDDPFFAADMADKARNSGFDVALAGTGKEAMELLESFRPTAIILDMHLPDISGETLLKQIKSGPKTRSIPVHTVSAGEESSFTQSGAIGFMQKPVNRKAAEGIFEMLKLQGKDLGKQRILLIEDDSLQSKYVGDFLTENDIFVLYAYSAAEARELLVRESVDGIILDIRLTDANGLDFLEEIKRDPLLEKLPVVVNTAEDLSQTDLARVMKYAHPVVMKSRKSNERLLDEVKLFLKNIRPGHAKSPTLDGESGNAQVHSERVFAGRRLLIADDDMRNIFALSAVLEEAGFSIVIAMNGKEAIEKLEEDESIELVLMDVMMPEMDGIEATRIIRSHARWQDLPIIAVTAKAMQGDRQLCLSAGASDYVSKPVNIDQLLSLIKVWLHAA